MQWTWLLMTPQCRIKWRQVRRNWGSSRSFPSPTNCQRLRLHRSTGKRPFRPSGLATIGNRFSITANKQLNYTVRKWKPDSSWNQMHRTWDGCAQKWDHRKVALFVGLKAQSDVVWPHQQITGKATTGWIFIATIWREVGWQALGKMKCDVKDVRICSKSRHRQTFQTSSSLAAESSGIWRIGRRVRHNCQQNWVGSSCLGAIID